MIRVALVIGGSTYNSAYGAAPTTFTFYFYQILILQAGSIIPVALVIGTTYNSAYREGATVGHTPTFTFTPHPLLSGEMIQ